MDVGILGFVIAGLVVGFIVGMTGVGGGSLMTPILLWFGIPPAAAVGTDLLYASITKAGGVYVHQKNNNIDWSITGYLSLGSVPAAALTLLVLHYLHTDTKTLNAVIKHGLGVALLFTAVAIVFKQQIIALASQHAGDRFKMSGRRLNALTVLTGVVLGAIVTLTSIGAGALGTVALFLLYPLMTTKRLVGTEIAHAVPLTLVAGLGHASMGNMDWSLLAYLLMGSLPGIYFGSHLSGVISDRVLRPCLATMLVFIGYKLIF
ncbi:sulfite exporter TauE/SafE family protein [Deefgea salmonis]|uniref:Probable membrane transporter protein n=1 Tax=Deefgea salmonis TaxID=2875502 RepID=A0ABS8BIV3_9NEIS|nr:sulfite exporter TauE/SafE family protein [Deefgea salmonis]MCB5195650.1 sulfite exporter TauE/SafE family protein [Deefgea salmonis]